MTEAEAKQLVAEFDRKVKFKSRLNKEKDVVEFSFDDVIKFSKELYEKLVSNPILYVDALQQHIRATLGPKTQLFLTGDPIGHRVCIPRELTADHMCQMYKVVGIVTKVTTPGPSIQQLVTFDLEKKEHQVANFQDPYTTLNRKEYQQFIPGRDEGKEREYGLSTFISKQNMSIQDCPEHVPQGRMSRSVQIVLIQQLIDISKPGDRVEVVGVLLPAPLYGPADAKSQQVKVFLLAFSVRTIQRSQTIMRIATNDYQLFLSESAKLAPTGVSQSTAALHIISASLAPSICGHDLIKRAIALQLLAGVRRTSRHITVRGDINVLLIGAPGCGKSQLLRAAMNLSPVAVSANGRGSSGAGLTAAVIIDQNGGRTLEAGAFVLADGGLLCMDEFDKLQIKDRAAIHEAMEQQTVSVAKAGIQATLNARCAVLAAANFVFGGYDAERSVSENINMPDSLLSRFDLVFVLYDDPDADLIVAEHVVQNHESAEPYVTKQKVGQDAPTQTVTAQTSIAKADGVFAQLPVANFIVFNRSQHQRLLDEFTKQFSGDVRFNRFLLTADFLGGLLQFCRFQSEDEPRLSAEAAVAVADYYARLRKLETRGLIVTARALEAMIRLSTAMAKLSYPVRQVSQEDVTEAYVLVRSSMFGEPEREIRKSAGVRKEPTDEGHRYEMFVQAFGEILELRGNSISMKDLVEELKKWVDERAAIGLAVYSAEEVEALGRKMIKRVKGVVLEQGVFYI